MASANGLDDMSDLNASVPVTIVTGFLGAGKSTLINRILTEEHGLRIVVVENEFGDDVSIESAIVRRGISRETNNGGRESALTDLIELPNGCMCCSAQDDLVRGLSELVRTKRDKFDYVVIETSGLADPGPVAAMFWLDEGLESLLKLDAIVTVVDGAHFARLLRNDDSRRIKASRLAQKQIAMSDVILVNKSDLLKEEDGLPGKIRRFNGRAKILVCERCNVDLSGVLNLNSYDYTRLKGFLNATHDHLDSDVSSFSVTFNKGEVFDPGKLDRAFGELLWGELRGERDHEIWRVKALVNMKGEDEKFVLQAVHTLFDSDAIGEQWPNGETRVSRFIFIGRELDKKFLLSVLETAVADP